MPIWLYILISPTEGADVKGGDERHQVNTLQHKVKHIGQRLVKPIDVRYVNFSKNNTCGTV
jgi:hypothetical protein